MPRPYTAVAAALLSLPPAVFAQGTLFTFGSEVEPREVRGALRLPDVSLDESRVPGRVTALTAQDIRASGARTLQELLARLPGVVSFDEVGNNFQQTVDLRGFTASPVPATAVFVDGVRVNEANLGQVNWHLVPLEHVERVEVHPGPSTLHGRNALGGVIQIATRRGEEGFRGETGAGYGDGGRRKAWASAAGGARGFDYLVSMTREDDNGHRRHSDAGVATAMVKLGWRREGADAALSYLRADDRLQQPGSLTGAEIASDPEQNRSEVDNISRLDQLTYNHRQAMGHGLSLAVNAHLRDRREDTPLNRGRTSLSRSMADMRTAGGTAQLSRDGEVAGRRLLASVGAEASRSKAESSSSGDFGGFPFASQAETREEAAAVFGEAVLDLLPDRLTLTAGLRYDQVEIEHDDRDTPSDSGRQAFNRANPRAGLNWEPTEDVGLYALYSEAFRTPAVSEITALGPFSSAALRPVKARNYEVGARAALGRARAKASAFWEDVRDDIYAVFDPTQGFGRNVNIDKTRRVGVEWSLLAPLARTLEGSVGHAFTRATFQQDFTLDSVPFGATQQVRDGDRVPMVPSHRVTAGLRWTPREGWAGTADGACTSSRHLFGDEANDRAQLPSYCGLDLGASYERSGLRFFVKGYNVLGRRNQVRGIMSTLNNQAERFLVTSAGAQVFGGVSYRFSAGGVQGASAAAGMP